MARRGYQFRPLLTDDLAMVRQWLAMPHVVEWWGDPDQQFELVSCDLAEPAMEQFIVAAEDGPFGYLQCYDLRAWPSVAFGPQPDGTRAIDQFIGKSEMVGCGHGSGFIRQFVDELLANACPGEVASGSKANRCSPTRTCVNSGIYGVSRSYGITERSHMKGKRCSGAPRVITDPAPNNSRAIRAYEKAGFVRDRLVETSDGPAILMVRSR